MKFKISSIAINEIGQRVNQEDSIYPKLNQANDDDRLFIVCDGMGGHEKGEVASAVVCEALNSYIKSNCRTNEVFTLQQFDSALSEAFSKLNAKDDGSVKKMGTTLTFLYFHRGGAFAAHIGDSRIYHFRPSTQEILYQSRDHSLINDFVDSGVMTRDEAQNSGQKNVITRAMMPNEDNPAKPTVTYITDIKSGDVFYMCSDGMLEKMESDELLEMISDYSSLQSKRDALIKATAQNSDNHSAYLICIDEVTNESMDASQPNNEEENNYADFISITDAESDSLLSSDKVGETSSPYMDRESRSAPPQYSNQRIPQRSSSSNKQASKNGKSNRSLLIVLAVLLVLCIAGLYFYNKYKNSKDEESVRIEKVEQKNIDQDDRDNSSTSLDKTSASSKFSKKDNEAAVSDGSHDDEIDQPNVDKAKSKRRTFEALKRTIEQKRTKRVLAINFDAYAT